MHWSSCVAASTSIPRCSCGGPTPERTSAISELSTASDEIRDAPFSIGDGVLAAVVSNKEAVLLSNLRPSYKVPYYANACPVRALAAIPVVDDGIVRGVLALDRIENRAFTTAEHELVPRRRATASVPSRTSACSCSSSARRSSKGSSIAPRRRWAPRLEKDVVEAGVRAAREIASFELAAVTIWDEAGKMHEVCAARSEGGEIEDLVGQRFKQNTGLVSMVVTNRFPLPYKGEFDPAHQVVLSKRLPWPSIPRCSCCRCSITGARSARSSWRQAPACVRRHGASDAGGLASHSRSASPTHAWSKARDDGHH